MEKDTEGTESDSKGMDEVSSEQSNKEPEVENPGPHPTINTVDCCSLIDSISDSELSEPDKISDKLSNEPSTSKAGTRATDGEPPKKKPRQDDTWLCSSDDRSSFLDEFDSDEYTVTFMDKECILRNRVRELEKALQQSEQLRANQSDPNVPQESQQPPNDYDEPLDDRMFDNELDIASMSEGPENPIENYSSSSAEEPNPDNPNTVTIPSENHRTSEKLNLGFAVDDNLADDSDSDLLTPRSIPSPSRKLNSSDSELSEQDRWICVQCKSKSLPHFRYCMRCFRIRRNWLPKRPKSRRLKKRKAAKSQQQSVINPEPSEDEVDGPRRPTTTGLLPSTVSVDLNQAFLVDENNPALNRLDSSSLPGSITLAELLTPPPSNPNSQELLITIPAISLNLDSSITSFNSNDDLSDIATYTNIPSQDTSRSKICSLCCTREKNAAFVHNKIAHHFACYPCADKILKQNGKCPICRERVLRVVKIISV